MNLSEVIPGVTEGCYALRNSIEEYHADADSVSSTDLKLILRSPAHMKAAEDDGDEPTKAKEIGQALHVAVLEADEFDSRYAVFRGEGTRSGKEYKEFAKNLIAQGEASKSILMAAEYELVNGMRNAIMAYPKANLKKMFAMATRELSIYWTDEETGLKCRIRPDAFIPGVICTDLKKTQDARPEAFSRSCGNYGYDLQSAFYLEGLRRFCGENMPFLFLAVEEKRPHGVWGHEASPEFIESGLKKYRKALEIYAYCKKDDRWPCYESPYSIISLPRWAQ